MTTAATVAVNNQPVIASLHQQNPVIINAKQAAGKVIWPLDVTKPPGLPICLDLSFVVV